MSSSRPDPFEKTERRLSFRFTHDGQVKSRWFWWVTLPILDAIILSGIWGDLDPRPDGFSLGGVGMGVALLVLVNGFLPLMALGDALSPRVQVDLKANVVRVPALTGPAAFGLGFRQPAADVRFDDVVCLLEVPHDVLRNTDGGSFWLERVGLQVLTRTAARALYPSVPEGQWLERVRGEVRVWKLLAQGGNVSVFHASALGRETLARELQRVMRVPRVQLQPTQDQRRAVSG